MRLIMAMLLMRASMVRACIMRWEICNVAGCFIFLLLRLLKNRGSSHPPPNASIPPASSVHYPPQVKTNSAEPGHATTLTPCFHVWPTIPTLKKEFSGVPRTRWKRHKRTMSTELTMLIASSPIRVRIPRSSPQG